MTCQLAQIIFTEFTINLGSNIKHNRVFSISILHSPVSHHLFSLVRKMQALLQGKIWLERWFIQAVFGLGGTQRPFLQRRHKSFLGRPHPNASRNIQIVMWNTLSKDVQRHISFNSQNWIRSKGLSYHRIYQEGGRALMSGLTASILGISHALIYFPLYEHWKMYFKKTFEPNSDKLSSRYVFLSAIFSKCKKRLNHFL